MRTFWSSFDVSKGKRFCIESPNAQVLGLFFNNMVDRYKIRHNA